MGTMEVNQERMFNVCIVTKEQNLWIKSFKKILWKMELFMRLLALTHHNKMYV